MDGPAVVFLQSPRLYTRFMIARLPRVRRYLFARLKHKRNVWDRLAAPEFTLSNSFVVRSMIQWARCGTMQRQQLRAECDRCPSSSIAIVAKKLQAAEALAGRKTRCPQCQTVLEDSLGLRLNRPQRQTLSNRRRSPPGRRFRRKTPPRSSSRALASPRSPMIDLSAGGSVPPPAAAEPAATAPQVVAARIRDLGNQNPGSDLFSPGGRTYFLAFSPSEAVYIVGLPHR